MNAIYASAGFIAGFLLRGWLHRQQLTQVAMFKEMAEKVAKGNPRILQDQIDRLTVLRDDARRNGRI